MALILAIETSTDVCSTALLSGDELCAETVVNRPRIHAELLTSLMEEVVSIGGIGFEDLDALAVSAGPGSYTGLRIGVSAAKGMAIGRDLPLLTVPSLEVVAAQTAVCARTGDRICVVRKARKNEVYCSVFRLENGGERRLEMRCAIPAQVIELDQIHDLVNGSETGTLWITGDARERAMKGLPSTARRYPRERPAPTAYWVGRRAGARYGNKEFVDIGSFEPAYGRPFHTHERNPIFDRLPGDS